MFSSFLSIIERGVLSGGGVSTVNFCGLIAASAASVSFEWRTILTKRLTRRKTKNSVKANPEKALSRLPPASQQAPIA
jgi:hypothetical protein